MKKLLTVFVAVLVCVVLSGLFWTPSKAQDYLPTLKSNDAGNIIFGKGGDGELEKARQISLEILSRQSLNRNIGTADELKVEKVEIDDLQMAHTRVQQTVDGIPVWEGEAIVHLKSDGSLSTITDDLKDSIKVNTKPSLTADEAARIAESFYKGAAKATGKPSVEMWIYRAKDRDHLTYRIETPRIDGSKDTAIPVDFIDAQTGERVFGYDNLQTGTGSSLYSGTVTIGTSNVGSTFYMENLTRKVGTFNANNGTSISSALRFTDTDDIWNSPVQRAAVDAQYGAEATMNYYQAVHNRNGIDGSGGPGSQPATANNSIGLITSFVHYGSNYENAAWVPLGISSFMIYGDGNPSEKSQPFVSLDIGGHEFTHGVTQYTANLTYANESGALNESMSDVFGTMVERYAHPMTWNWKIGEEVSTTGKPARYMDNPQAAGDPDHYSIRLNQGICIPVGDDKDPGYNDNCGVHRNSGIANHAFYLTVAGGTNRVSGVTVQGIGPDNAAKIWYRALTAYMTPGTNFAGARAATLYAATDLFGASSSQYNSVATGWCAVGVGSCPNNGCPTTAISFGQIINASLATTDCILQDGSYVDTYIFNGTIGQKIVVSMNSSAFDSYLYLKNSSNEIVGEDNNGGGGTNSRIPVTSGFITLPETGTYTIYANSLVANKIGAYSISLTSESGGQCPITAINFGQPVNGSLTTSDCVLTGTTKYVDAYTFNGSSGQRIAISMNSPAIDSYLYLYNSSNQVVASDNNGGGGSNSRIPATSGYFTLPATGNYTIIASSFNAGESGAYTLALTQNCSFSLNQTNQSFSSDGGSGSVNVATGTNCAWSDLSNVAWVTTNDEASGTGNGTITFSVAANTGASRTGTITIAGQTFTVNQAAASVAVAKTKFDYDGDGKADISLFRPSDRVWYLQNSNTGSVSYTQFGLATDKIVPADYDGDGKTDIAVYRPSTGIWFIMKSSGGVQFTQFGISEDIPQPSDFNGDGKAEIAVFRPSTGVWFILSFDTTSSTATQFGASEDKPVAGDYDGDGKAEIAVYRPSLGVWFFYDSTTKQTKATRFGISTDKPVAADYDGDGKTDIAAYRPSDGNWYILGTTRGYTVTKFGLSTDVPTPADYDGDGKTDIAVYRPAEGNWYQLRSRDGFSITRFGLDTDKPTPNAFVY